ncbi:MAG: type II CRISPR RNA-guided endonuclease Cas9, partial [Elusimicrobiales bacterium]|nr:type II CRISPR RNA-guided endonuclease Cas9 [Elusimicrobiales bacterium]
MIKRILGIDIGITSLGWALIERNETDDKIKNDGRIIASGVRIFTKAENPKTGESLAKPRRDARLARRRNHRRAHRLAQIKNLFYKYSLIKDLPREKINSIYTPTENSKDPWQLRKDALYRNLTGEELAKVLTHIAKRRGFKSSRKSEGAGTDTAAKETQKLLSAITMTKKKLLGDKYQTAGEMFATDPDYFEHKRNKPNDYKNSIPRILLEEEIRTIFKIQRGLKSEFAREEFEKEYTRITFTQNPLQSMIGMVGMCTFEKKEKRAPKESYSAEIFTILGKTNNLILQPKAADKDDRFLNIEEIEKILNLCHTNAKVTFKQIRKELKLSDDWIFNTIDYNHIKKTKTGKEKVPEEETFFEMKGYHKIRKAIEKNCDKATWENLKNDKTSLNAIALALASEKDDENIRKKLKEAKIDNKIIAAVLEINSNKFMHLSVKAMDKIIPFMRKGEKYIHAAIKAGYDPLKPNQNEKKSLLLPKLTEDEEYQVTSPVAKRAITQYRKVLNAIIRDHGKFDHINIELARDLSNSYEKRREIEKGQKAFKDQKDEARERCKEINIDPDTKDNLLKFRLWEQQNGFCVYSNTYIEPENLAEENYVEIDHILPHSRSLDNSLNNKVLCLAVENQNKKNMIPFEYFQNKSDRWNEFVGWVESMKKLPKAKKSRLLKRKFDKKDMEGFKERNINDTRHISRFIKNWTENNLDFAQNEKSKQKVFVRSGSLTAFLRHQWGLTKNREENDKPHALDAIVTACATQGMVKFI